MIECAKCGSENKFDGAAFCKSCGAELSAPKPVATAVKDIAAERDDEHLESTSPHEDSLADREADNASPELRDESQIPSDDAEISAAISTAEVDSSLEEHSAEPSPTGIPPHEVTTTDFDRALKKYNEEDDQVQDESLQIESAADVLMRTQTEDENQEGTGTLPKEEQNQEIQENESTGSETSSQVSDETVSPSDKQQLLDNLSKTLNGETTNTQSDKPREGDIKQFGDDDKPDTSLNLESTPSEAAWSSPVDEEPITDSPAHDILHIRGNKVLLALTPPPRPGESIKFRGKKYTLTRAPIDKKTIGLSGILLLIFVAIIVIQQMTAPVPPQPSLFGVVKNSETNEVLAGVNVSIPQLEIFTVTDEYGSFSFVGLQNETYQVRLEGELYEAKFYPVSISENNSAFLQASLDPLLPDKRRSQNNTAAEKPAKPKPKLGELKINCNVEDAEVFVNGKELGAVDRTFTRMKTGDHTLLVQREGFDDFTQPITIDPGETTVVTVNLLKSQPDKPKALTAADHFNTAEELMQYHKYTEAAGHYTLALAKDRNYIQAYLRRGEANVALGKNLAARADYRAAADYYINSGRYDNAIQCFDKILDLAPNSVGALQMRGWAKIWSQKNESGLIDLNRALALVPDDVDARFQVGKALYVTGNYKEAEKTLKKIRDEGDSKPEIYAYLALTHLARNDEGDARKSYEKFREHANSSLQARMSAETAWQKLLAIQD